MPNFPWAPPRRHGWPMAIHALAATGFLTLAVAGCTTSNRGSHSPATHSSAAASTSATAATSTTASTFHPAIPSTDVADCFEGNCLLAVSGTVTVPLDEAAFSYPAVTITVEAADMITVHPTGDPSSMSFGPGSEGSFGALHIWFSPTGPGVVLMFRRE